MLEDNIEEVLPQLSCLAMVARRARDTIVSQQWAERVTYLLVARLVVVPRWGHALNYSALRRTCSVAHSVRQELLAFRHRLVLRSPLAF